MGKIIVSAVICVIAVICFLISCRQFKEKGFLFNNAYIFASKEEREKMNKKPHYKQSGIVFFMLGIIFLMMSVDFMIKTSWLFYCEIIVVAVIIVYAVLSYIRIERRMK